MRYVSLFANTSEGHDLNIPEERTVRKRIFYTTTVLIKFSNELKMNASLFPSRYVHIWLVKIELNFHSCVFTADFSYQSKTYKK